MLKILESYDPLKIPPNWDEALQHGVIINILYKKSWHAVLRKKNKPLTIKKARSVNVAVMKL